jgi:hypothetical protein
MVGADVVAKAPGDGYTLLMSAGSTMVVVPTLTPKMPYDPNKDLVPVAATARLELFLVVRANSPFNTFADLQKFARANPGKLSYGSPGNGSTPHIGAEMLKNMAGIFAVHIPYRGSAPALQDLLAGNLDFFMDPGIAAPHIRSGALRLLAVGSTKRSFLYPDTPTLAELGLKGYDGGSTHSFYAPAGTPPGRGGATQPRDQSHPGDAIGHAVHPDPGRRAHPHDDRPTGRAQCRRHASLCRHHQAARHQRRVSSGTELSHLLESGSDRIGALEKSRLNAKNQPSYAIDLSIA